jgi:hypothetical protein
LSIVTQVHLPQGLCFRVSPVLCDCFGTIPDRVWSTHPAWLQDSGGAPALPLISENCSSEHGLSLVTWEVILPPVPSRWWCPVGGSMCGKGSPGCSAPASAGRSSVRQADFLLHRCLLTSWKAVDESACAFSFSRLPSRRTQGALSPLGDLELVPLF